MQNIPASNSALARWTVALCEPLLTTACRQQIDEEVDAACYEEPEYVALWGIAMLCTVLYTLPDNDPYRNLSAAFYPRDGSAPLLAPRPGNDAPAMTGAKSGNRAFGNRRDTSDLIIPEFDDWTMDLGLAAVAPDLDPRSAALVGFASHGWEMAYAAAVAMGRELIAETKLATHSKETLREILSGALVRAIHRRRAYVGQNDGLIAAQGFAWIVRARQWLDVDPRQLSETKIPVIRAELDPYKIPNEDYENFRFV